ncbi:hypothetical protein [Elizabethkingia anophelis]|uniref:hypothetical protein n=1 Tax=Elizabethkingia anophelis TaxID=1117645 RepID=UPI00291FA3C2|nr:hypothetical protein [Elizabethkingia anophelis]MDV3830407.1 hypothetical protein [Elizabethkingia anophelis]MDV4078199.1 hypothetical protein [Elizabethkingia anophelis]WMC06430.1 MAG: hypothetical protein PQ275_10490 [Elizabethkingia anophelis]
MRIKIILGLKEFYTKQISNPIDLLLGYDPDYLLLTISNINFQINKHSNDIKIIQSIYILDQLTIRTYTHLSTILKYSEKNKSHSCIIFNEKTNNNFFKLIFSNYSLLKSNKNEKLLLDDFITIYLKLNETTFGSEGTDFTSFSREYYNEYAQIIFYSKIYELDRPKRITFQILKMKCLLNYFYINYKEILNEFYKEKGISNPDIWLSTLISSIKNENKSESNLFKLDEGDMITSYFKEITINHLLNKKINTDHLMYHSIFNINDSVMILNWNYLFHSFYHRINYELFSKYKKQIRPDFDFHNYKSIISTEVSEKLIFRYVVKKLIKSKPSITEVIFESKLQGFPDCYLRIGNQVFIFEFKDYLPPPSFLESYKYDDVYKYINENFLEKKGIAQLEKFIKNSNISDFDSKLENNRKKLEIFPILVVSEDLFSLPALENIFTKELHKRLENKDYKSINKLVVLNINEMIDFFIHNNRDDFFKLIVKYSRSKNKKRKSNSLLTTYPDFKYDFLINAQRKDFEDIFIDFPITDFPDFGE